MDDSPAYQFMQIMWHHQNGAKWGGAWSRLNHAMARTLIVAIQSGLTFEKKDFVRFVEDFDAYRWIGENAGERMYSAACDSSRNLTVPNLTAARAYEFWRVRKPFFWQGKRLAVGRAFRWEDREVRVTSFHDGNDTLTACAYGEYPDHRRVEKRYTITHAALRAAQKPAKVQEDF